MVLHRKVKRMDEDEVMPIIDLPDVDDPSEVPEQPEEQAKVVNKARKIEEIPYREAFQYAPMDSTWETPARWVPTT